MIRDFAQLVGQHVAGLCLHVAGVGGAIADVAGQITLSAGDLACASPPDALQQPL